MITYHREINLTKQMDKRKEVAKSTNLMIQRQRCRENLQEVLLQKRKKIGLPRKKMKINCKEKVIKILGKTS